MIKCNTIPFEWDRWDKQDELVHTYYNAKFLEDFGVFKKDEILDIMVDFGKGLIEYFDDYGNLLKYQNFKSVTI